MIDVKNISPNHKGALVRFGYKTEKGLIAMIKRMNANSIKHGFKTKIEITFPVKKSWNHKL